MARVIDDAEEVDFKRLTFESEDVQKISVAGHHISLVFLWKHRKHLKGSKYERFVNYAARLVQESVQVLPEEENGYQEYYLRLAYFALDSNQETPELQIYIIPKRRNEHAVEFFCFDSLPAEGLGIQPFAQLEVFDLREE